MRADIGIDFVGVNVVRIERRSVELWRRFGSHCGKGEARSERSWKSSRFLIMVPVVVVIGIGKRGPDLVAGIEIVRRSMRDVVGERSPRGRPWRRCWGKIMWRTRDNGSVFVVVVAEGWSLMRVEVVAETRSGGRAGWALIFRHWKEVAERHLMPIRLLRLETKSMCIK